MENTIYTTSDGSHSVISGAFGVSYHSRHGAIQESDHVFLECGLRYKAQTNNKISILEIGMGTGLNAYLTLLEAERLGVEIDYITLEKYPLAASAYKLLNYPTLLHATSFETHFLSIHECNWEERQLMTPNFAFTKSKQDAATADFLNRFDLVYFDAFAPEDQPELWSTEVFRRMFNSLKDEGALLTYCAKGQVRRNMQTAGFKTERLPGPPGKREMLRAIKPTVKE